MIKGCERVGGGRWGRGLRSLFLLCLRGAVYDIVISMGRRIAERDYGWMDGSREW